MRTLSALEAISPAFSRTKDVLFNPFRVWRGWKLAITAYFATTGTLFLPLPFFYLFLVPSVLHAGKPQLAVGIVVGIFVVSVIFLGFFYLCSRLQFAFFDIVLHRGQFVAPAWRKYGRQNTRWTAFKVFI